jgi:hypothetical protein
MNQLEMFQQTLRGRWGWLIPWTVCLLLVLLIVIIGEIGGLKPWGPISDDAKYACEHCEHIARNGFFHQVANFWSNFVYLAAGLIILFSGESTAKSGVAIALIRKGVGLTFVALSIGSGLFHGTITDWGKTLDIVGVYVAFLAILFYGLLSLFDINLPESRMRLPEWLLVSLFCLTMVYAVFAAFTRTHIALHDSDVFMPLLGGLLLILTIICAVRYRKRETNWGWPLGATLLSFVAAGIFKYLDGKYCTDSSGLFTYLLKFCDGECQSSPKFVCDVFGSNPILQGHALWHVASGVGVLSVMEFFTSLHKDLRTVWPWRD